MENSNHTPAAPGAIANEDAFNELLQQPAAPIGSKPSNSECGSCPGMPPVGRSAYNYKDNNNNDHINHVESTPARREYHMPTEILLRIFHYAIGSPGCRIKWQHALADDYRFHYPHVHLTPNDIAKSTCTLCPLLNLYNWALVNRQWNAIITPFLYSEIDIHTLAIPGHVVDRPVLFRRDIWPFGTATEQVATSMTCLLAEATASERIGQILPVPKYGNYSRMRTRRLQRGKDERVLERGSMVQWHKWNEYVPTPEQTYMVEFEYAPGEFEVGLNEDMGLDNEPDFMRYETKRIAEYAPIRTPKDCCFPTHHHHNFTPEWWDLLRMWEDPTEQNPISHYTLNRVLIPLVRTLTERPDLAVLVRKIQLPLVVYQDYVLMNVTDDPMKKRPLTLVGSDVSKPEEQRLRLREMMRMGSKRPERPSVRIQLLQSTLTLVRLCARLDSLEGFWSMDIAALHQKRAEKQLSEALTTDQEQNQTVAQLETPEPQATGSSPRKQANRISRLFTRVISRKSSRNKLVENEVSMGGSHSDNLSSEASDHSRSVSNASSGDSSTCDPQVGREQGDEVINAHNSLQKAMMNNNSTPGSLWTEIFATSITKLKHWKIEFGSPFAMALPDCSWTSHCGTNPNNKLCDKRYWHRYLDPANVAIFTELLFRAPSNMLLNHWPLERLENLVHLEFTTIEEDAIYDHCGMLVEMTTRFGQAMEKGLPNFRKLSVMDSYINLLSVVPNNRLESLNVSRWHTTKMHMSLLLSYISRSYDSLTDKSEAALKHLTLDTVSGKLGSAYWNGEEWYPLLIGGVSTCKVTLPCGAERQIFDCGDIHSQYFLKLEVIYKIIRCAPNLQELVLRRGRLALDEYWKMQLEAEHMNWYIQRHTQAADESTGEEFSPPIAHNLTSLAFLLWGEGPRTWLLHSLQHDRIFPNLQYVTFASATSEQKRSQKFRKWYREGQQMKRKPHSLSTINNHNNNINHNHNHNRQPDFRFCSWDAAIDEEVPSNPVDVSAIETEDMNKAVAIDGDIFQILHERGVKVSKDEVMQGWKMRLPKYKENIIIPGSWQQRGPIPVDNVDSGRLWRWYYGQIRTWWLRSWRSPVTNGEGGLVD